MLFKAIRLSSLLSILFSLKWPRITASSAHFLCPNCGKETYYTKDPLTSEQVNKLDSEGKLPTCVTQDFILQLIKDSCPQNETCEICHVQIDAGSSVFSIPQCLHKRFHKNCLLDRLSQDYHCPTCQRELPLETATKRWFYTQSTDPSTLGRQDMVWMNTEEWKTGKLR
ncbi:uncharacterized protein LOC129298885 [Prosopis cineraria]|uniref:uncharacterized protein LOC129298885 n=1 Tax=Prosopis cineraria TaxID=364024 RepID=UPI002410033C|nr:uncharacterized protein LOC129298885 [Prosopis cineraria]